MIRFPYELHYPGVDKETRQALVLIIEDNRDISRFIAETLAAEYRIATAYDGQEGLTKALDLQPDLILTDVMMPEMSGDQVVSQVRIHPELDIVPIVLLSTRTDEALRVQLLREGAQDYLVKPFCAEELRARVANLITMKRVRQILMQEEVNKNEDLATLVHQVIQSRRETEHQLSALRESEQRKDIFLSMASHELRTPLTSIKAFTQILQKMLIHEGRTQVVQYLTKMEIQVNKMISLIDNLQDISRIESGQLALVKEEFEVDAFVREIIDTLQTSSTKHTIILTGHAHTTLVGDKDRLGQVFTNLLTNAIKYSPAAQTVDVSVTTNQEQVTISVRDYGIGIPKVHQARIFERFYRVSDKRDRKCPGLGIGLYIASEIIKCQRGTIWVESEEERGSTFSFSLPLKKREEEGISHPFGWC